MKTLASHLLAAALLLAPVAASPGGPVQVDVLYMNHGPLQATLGELRSLFAGYGPRVAVAWHEVGTDEGEQFKARKKLSGHIPLVIWVNDSHRLQVGGREVSFTGFPSGSGPAAFQGKWTLADLAKALDEAAARK